MPTRAEVKATAAEAPFYCFRLMKKNTAMPT